MLHPMRWLACYPMSHFLWIRKLGFESLSGSSPLSCGIAAGGLEAEPRRVPIKFRSFFREGRITASLGPVILGSIVVLICVLVGLTAGISDSRGGDAVASGARGRPQVDLTGSRHATQVARTLASPRWVRATLSHYGTTGDGYLGGRTNCGKIVRPGSVFVAALHPHLAKCGLKLTIYHRGKRYHVRVQDRGAWRSDNRALDAAPGLRSRLGFTGVASIRYRKGWN